MEAASVLEHLSNLDLTSPEFAQLPHFPVMGYVHGETRIQLRQELGHYRIEKGLSVVPHLRVRQAALTPIAPQGCL